MSQPNNNFPSQAGGFVTFVGVGSADLSLLTMAGLRAIAQADLIVADEGLDAAQLRLAGVETTAQIDTVTAEPASQLLRALDQGQRVVRLTTCESADRPELLEVLQRAKIHTRVIPAIAEWQTALLYSGVLDLANLSVVTPRSLDPDWPEVGTTVLRVSSELRSAVRAAGLERHGPHSSVLEVIGLGSADQQISWTTWGELSATADEETRLIFGPTVLPELVSQNDWFSSKPLFDWSVLIPQTKDELSPLVDQLTRYGARSEIVTTMSVEPPRTEQAMERAMRGLIDGRYLWLVLTSPHAVTAIAQRLADYGLDSRALSGVFLAVVGKQTLAALHSHGLRADLVPEAAQTAAALAGEFPAFDELIDPLNRVLIPSADVAVAPLLEGLQRLGWEPEEVTAFRTVRAAPPPAETRDRIKTGLFDAVIFTSSTAVRNMIGIAGKPHASSIVAAIGPATAEACEDHGLRVDVVAAEPTYASVVAGLAEFAIRRRAERLDQGLPDTKPSQRKRRRRRKPKEIAEAE